MKQPHPPACQTASRLSGRAGNTFTSAALALVAMASTPLAAQDDAAASIDDFCNHFPLQLVPDSDNNPAAGLLGIAPGDSDRSWVNVAGSGVDLRLQLITHRSQPVQTRVSRIDAATGAIEAQGLGAWQVRVSTQHTGTTEPAGVAGLGFHLGHFSEGHFFANPTIETAPGAAQPLDVSTDLTFAFAGIDELEFNNTVASAPAGADQAAVYVVPADLDLAYTAIKLHVGARAGASEAGFGLCAPAVLSDDAGAAAVSHNSDQVAVDNSLDSDGDGIADHIEGNGDFDSGGTADYLDTDSDNDGIADSIEAGISVDSQQLIDTDGDGMPDLRDVDSDGDGIPDAIEGNQDTDGSGVPDYLDLDSDNDGISDTEESGIDLLDSDGDGIPDSVDVDQTGSVDENLNGVDDNGAALLRDTDGDGIPDLRDVDSDDDGLPDAIEGTSDNDGGGIPDYRDQDIDNDGILDGDEAQVSGFDSDEDGIDDLFDVDLTGGIDSDLDGIDDVLGTAASLLDSDGDGIPNTQDLDSDADGVPDAIDSGSDSDAAGLPNYLDVDSDNDGIHDGEEARITGVDSDGDGIDDLFDVDVTGGVDNNNNGIDDIFAAGTVDTDGDGIPNVSDVDSDNDRIPDALEGTTDSDNGGSPNYLDPDSDNDGIVDGIESAAYWSDADDDGIDDRFDVDFVGGLDENNNGISDELPFGLPDTDGDGLPDYIDVDADGDLLPDALEGNVDSDADGIPDYLNPDIDDNGIDDGLQAGGSGIDSDGDGIDESFEPALAALALADVPVSGVPNQGQLLASIPPLAPIDEAGGGEGLISTGVGGAAGCALAVNGRARMDLTLLGLLLLCVVSLLRRSGMR